jgi:hypothetical protein
MGTGVRRFLNLYAAEGMIYERPIIFPGIDFADDLPGASIFSSPQNSTIP